jgi:SNF2 family DNA or RNA helicase
VVEGSPTERAQRYHRTSNGFLVANYEQILRDLDVVLAWDPEIVVLDEAQRIKNWATKTAAVVKRLRPRYRLVLTGTPMENRLEELASIMDWVDDHALEPKWRLVPWHSVFADGSREVVGARHLDTLRERVAPRMLRRVRSEVLSQLPPRTDTVIPVEMSDAQREEHDALDQPIASLVQRAHRRPLTQAEFLRLMTLLTTKRIIANGLAQHRFTEIWPGIERARPHEALLASLSSPKLAEARALLAALVVEQERKVVVFSQWRRMLRLVHWAVGDVLADAGLRATFFTGQETTRQRTRNLVDFHDDPAARVLFASDAGGVGLNLQRAASACVLLDLPWNPAVLEQRVGRIYRLGQKRPIDVYSLVSEGSIEERIASLVSDKRALFRGLFDGTSDSVRFDRSSSFLGSLEKLVGAEAAASAALESEETNEEVEEETADAALETWLGDDAGDGRRSARGSEDSDLPVADAGPVAPAPDVAGLFAGLVVERTVSGGLRIEAPPETAASLASLFEGFAAALRRAAH